LDDNATIESSERVAKLPEIMLVNIICSTQNLAEQMQNKRLAERLSYFAGTISE
jgi:hypothetical protein